LLAIIGYQFSDSGKLPNLSNFAQGVTCTSSGNVVTVSAASGEKIVVSFPSLIQTVENPEPNPDNILYYDVDKQGERAIPMSLLDYIEKYKGVINFARDCLINSIHDTGESSL
jgi:hypothetical protein